MDRLSNNIKFYTFINILSKYSDENISISTKEINDHMNNMIGVTLDRRTIYSYIKDMQFIGINVSSYNEETGGYHFANHNLEEYEIRILVDAIASSKFITKKKSIELIEKLSMLNSVYILRNLSTGVYIDDRPKSINEEIFINIDKINFAIKNERQIEFNYYDYNYKKHLTPRKSIDNIAKIYVATPVSMILKDENYYLILADDKHNDLSNYRIDRMKNIKILDVKARDLSGIKDCANGFNEAIYSKKSFKMFTGSESIIEIEFKKCLLNFMIDEFGDGITITKKCDKSYNGKFIGKVGKGLARWIFQLGKDVVVLSPMSLIEEIKMELQEMSSLYKIY